MRLSPIRWLASALLGFALFTVTLSWPAPAASEDKPEPTREQLQTQVSIMTDHIKKLEAQLSASPASAELQQAYFEAKKKEYQYVTALMDANIAAFDAQRVASHVILSLVVLVVVSGTAFAGFQLWKSVTVGGVQSSDLELSASRVRVTSSVVGVVVLTISLVFLYIYVHEIYQIRPVGVPTVSTEPKSSK
jgi:hypothetical protein